MLMGECNPELLDPACQKMHTHIAFPAKGLVYDYFFDKKVKIWQPWSILLPSYVIPLNATFQDIIVPTVDIVRYGWILDLFINHEKPLLFAGATGTAKTVIVRNKLLNDLDKKKFSSLFIGFSAQTSANQTQDMIDARLMRRRLKTWAPQYQKHLIIFVDDLNMPARDKYGAQPPIELLRQYFDHNGWYDRAAHQMRYIIDCNIIAAMGPPGGGRNPLRS